MQTHVSSTPSGRGLTRENLGDITRVALDERELSIRWGLSVHTLRRWRQEQIGPVFCKLGRRVTYLMHEVEAFERRVSRHSSFARAYQQGARP